MPLETEDTDDLSAESEAVATTVLDEEVTVTGQTVVDTGTIIVLAGHSLMPGPQL